jgi:hypothetical protein
LKPWTELGASHIYAMAFKDWANRETTLTSLSLGADAMERLASQLSGAKAE